MCRQLDSANLVELVMTATDKVQQQVIASLLKAQADKVEETSSGQKELRLQTATKPLTVTYGAPKRPREPQPQISADAMLELQSDLGLSDRDLKRVGQTIRSELGKNYVEKI